VPIYLVRHAKAGNRSAWTENDRDRPLVDNGWDQAQALATRLSALSPSVLWSSPYLRCQQTLQPLGELCGLDIVADSRLEEESPLEKLLAILDDAPDNAVLCSHGDVIPDAVNGLIRRGMDIDNVPRSVKKGSVFVLHRENGLYVRAEYWEPPKN